MKLLNERQKKFVKEYLVDYNATQAAIRAGYTAHCAGVAGHQLLKNPKIIEAFQLARNKQYKRAELSVAYIIEGLQEVAERSLQRTPVMMRDPEDGRRFIQKTEEVLHEDGTITEAGVWEFDSMGANKAFELLGKHKGAFPDKHIFSGPNNGPIMMRVGRLPDNVTPETLLQLAKMTVPEANGNGNGHESQTVGSPRVDP